MKINLLDNGWTIQIDELDLRTASDDEINTIGQLINTNTVVVLKDQHLTVSDETDIVNRFGSARQMPDKKLFDGYYVNDSDRHIVRVTGQLDDHGRPGLFGHVTELDWHCNDSAHAERKPLIWLYGVTGTVGSRTSFINNILSYETLQKEDPEFFNQVKDLKVVCGYETGRYSPTQLNDQHRSVNPHFTPNIVQTNIAGKTGFYCSPLQVFYFDGMTEEESRPILERLRDFIIQERFMYHHDWNDNDVLLSEQWLGIHKRWEFERIHERVLHRIEGSFEHIKFN
jgi:taurine dioxygenase